MAIRAVATAAGSPANQFSRPPPSSEPSFEGLCISIHGQVEEDRLDLSIAACLVCPAGCSRDSLGHLSNARPAHVPPIGARKKDAFPQCNGSRTPGRSTEVRLVLDLQGAQSIGSRSRGIGRYSLALAKEIAAKAETHELWIALSGLFPDTVEPLRAIFDGLVPQERVVVWTAPGAVAHLDPPNRWRIMTGELIREAFLTQLRPDVVHLSSLFEGLGDDTLTSINSLANTSPTAVTLYDLIPLIHPDAHLQEPVVASWYQRKVEHLRRADLWLAIAECSRRDGIDRLNLPDEWVVNIGAAADSIFRPMDYSPDERQVHQEQHRRRVLKETDERNVRIDGQPDGAVEEQVLVADGCERDHHIGEKHEKGEPGGPGRSLAALASSSRFPSLLVTIGATLAFRWVPVASLRKNFEGLGLRLRYTIESSLGQQRPRRDRAEGGRRCRSVFARIAAGHPQHQQKPYGASRGAAASKGTNPHSLGFSAISTLASECGKPERLQKPRADGLG